MKSALALTAAATIAFAAVTSSSPAEARWRGGGWGPGIAAGLVGAAVIGGIASSAYAYGPGYGGYGYPGYGYGYPRYGYYGGYAPAYAGYGYQPYRWGGGYTTTYYNDYAPAYYGPRYRRVVRPAFAYYGGPYVRRHVRHVGWHGRHW